MMTAEHIDVKKLGVLKVKDDQGKSHDIASFWEQQRAALVFVRHFG